MTKPCVGLFEWAGDDEEAPQTAATHAVIPEGRAEADESAPGALEVDPAYEFTLP